jgi:hypothetical protein
MWAHRILYCDFWYVVAMLGTVYTGRGDLLPGRVRILDIIMGVEAGRSPEGAMPSSAFCQRLLLVMIWATEGMNLLSEMQCRSVLAAEDIVHALTVIDGFRFPVIKVRQEGCSSSQLMPQAPSQPLWHQPSRQQHSAPRCWEAA